MDKKRILIVDDDLGMCESLSDIFQEKGYLVSVANQGSVAINKLGNTDFNIALIDIKLPDMDGTVLLNKIKKDYPEMDCIIITGNASVENAAKALNFGASAYIVKPPDMDDVLNRIKDLLHKQQLKQKLIESEENYRTLFKNTGTATVILEENMDISLANSEFVSLSGYSKEEIENKMKWTDFVHPEDLERIKKYHLARRKAGEKAPTEYEFRLIDKKGNIKNIFSKIGIILNTKKSIASMIDISELKKVQEGLRSSREEYFNLFNNANDLIHVINPARKFLAVNKKWLETLEYSQEEVKGLRSIDIIRKDKLKQIKEQMQEIKKGKSIGFETVFISKSGKEINVEGRGNGLFKDGKYLSAVGIFRDITERKQAEEKLKKTMNATIETMSKIVEVKDPYTSGHQLRVSRLTAAIAKELNLSPDKIEGIRIASLIHDIGKISVPTEILSKSIKLSDIEFSLIKEHSQIGYDILKSIDFSYPVAEIVLQHHEKIDGSGYPRGLKGDEIFLEAKIICVADVVEAMSSHRPYRPALGIDAALEEISQNKGILYDPEVVVACLKLFKEKGFKFK